jgi:hypothetical protein
VEGRLSRMSALPRWCLSSARGNGGAYWGFEKYERERKWPSAEIETLKNIANTLGAAFCTATHSSLRT